MRPVQPALSVIFVGLLLGCWSLLLGCEREQRASPIDLSSALPPGASGMSRRVVSLSPAASLFVRAIGAEDRLVGLDRESARVLGRADLPTMNVAGDAIALAPDLVLLPGVEAGEAGEAAKAGEIAEAGEVAEVAEVSGIAGEAGISGAVESAEAASRTALRASGASLIEFAPHDLDDLLSLVRELGPRLVGRAAAVRFELGLSRPLAEIGGSSYGELRPRVAAIVGVEPLELAGGHSFETDLIEIAGGSSLTHGGEETRIRARPGDRLLREPDLFVHFSVVVPEAATRRRLRSVLPGEIPLVFFEVDFDRFWLEAPAEHALRLRRSILSSLAAPDSAALESAE